MRLVKALFLLACAARAGDSAVEQLEAELRALVAATDQAAGEAVVSVAGAGAILAGTPPRVVAPYGAAGEAARAKVRLPDGREVTATRWGGDAELGIVVLKLPDDVANDLKGVDVEGDWAHIGVGSIALAAGGRGRGGPRLGLVTAAEPRVGVIDAPGEGVAVFGSRGRLIGLRGGPDLSACAACHSPASTAVGVLADVRYRKWTDATELLKALAPDQPFQAGNELARDPWTAAAKAGRPTRDFLGCIVAGPVIRRVLDDLEQHGAIRHAYLGVVIGNLARERAVKVTSVVPGSPAEAAKLHDMVFDAIDGLACPSAELFGRVLALHRPGEEVTLSRAGRPLVKVTLGELKEANPAVATTAMLGLSCVNLGPELRRFLGIEEAVRGVMVLDVEREGRAAAAGLVRGLVITRCGGMDVADIEELEAALASAKGSVEIEGVHIDEGRRRMTITW